MGFNKVLIVGTLLLSVVFVSLSTMLLSVGANYDVTVDPAYQNLFNKQKEIEVIYAENEQIIENGNINPSGFGAAAYTNTIVAAKQSSQSAQLFQELIFEMPKIFGIPVYFVFAFATIVFVLSTFAFIELVSGRTP